MMIGVFVWLVVVLIVFAVAMAGLAYLGVLGPGRIQRRLTTPEDILRDRYARGEIARQAYVEAITDVLKDRYVRGELTAEEYEERLGDLLRPADVGDQRRLPPTR
jgi:uncharacterized membrane protein